MTFAKRLFVAIDKLFDGSQNRRKMTRYEDKNFVIQTNIVYDRSDEKTCLLDTYHVEKKEGKYPVFFYIHGGGFVAGDKHFRRAHSRWAAAQGFFVVNVNYALSPDYLFPTPVRNLVAALNWVGENAERLNLDLDKIVVSGDSAGGYYSAMLACICTNEHLREKLGVSTNLRFAAAVLNCGIYDVGTALKRYMPFNLTDKILFDFAGIHVQQFDSFEWKDICAPFDFVNKDFPPSFVTYAEKDIFCKGQGERMVAKLNELGIYSEEYHSKKIFENHCFSLTWTSKAARENNKLTESFLKRFINGEIKNRR